MIVTWLSPGDPAQRTGGYRWNAAIARALRSRGVGVDVRVLSGAWPLPGLESGAEDLLAVIPDGRVVIADGLLWPGLGAHGAALAARCPVIVVVHSLLAREGPETADRDAWERASWAPVRARVATSRLTAGALGPGAPVAVVPPGADDGPRTSWSPPRRAPPEVLTVGTLTRRKGHDLLVDALAAAPTWRLRCAGGARDPAWAASLRARAADRGVEDRIHWLGDLDEVALDAAYACADLVVQVARYEAYGMAIAEAVVRGCPVLTAPAGVLDHLPPDTVAVLAPDACVDSDVLAGVLGRWLGAIEDRRALARRAAAVRLPSWDIRAGELLDVVRAVGGAP